MRGIRGQRAGAGKGRAGTCEHKGTGAPSGSGAVGTHCFVEPDARGTSDGDGFVRRQEVDS
jgi:hypothetical protein